MRIWVIRGWVTWAIAARSDASLTAPLRIRWSQRIAKAMSLAMRGMLGADGGKAGGAVAGAGPGRMMVR
ncbi:hypothetical protein LBMAG53_39150 [Planctomycetota bacterium]|nr:hypothetical protein LBMAG53_39150 [Planctomycetota bacterium]